VQPDQVADSPPFTDWLKRLADRLNAVNGSTARYSLGLVMDDEGKPSALRIQRNHHGVATEKLIQKEFFESPEYRRIVALGADLNELIGEGGYVARGERSKEVTSFQEAMTWLMAEARKGQSFQRYKGLGEMNPSQLWDTTMDPQTRRLMQVRIEDAVAADEIFTTLMGDQVEPRRDFIERNALSVSNLDI
jgi:DNA gyrase subunit B